METTRTLHEFSKASDAADLIRSARAVMKTQQQHIAEAEKALADMGMRLDGDRIVINVVLTDPPRVSSALVEEALKEAREMAALSPIEPPPWENHPVVPEQRMAHEVTHHGGGVMSMPFTGPVLEVSIPKPNPVQGVAVRNADLGDTLDLMAMQSRAAISPPSSLVCAQCGSGENVAVSTLTVGGKNYDEPRCPQCPMTPHVQKPDGKRVTL